VVVTWYRIFGDPFSYRISCGLSSSSTIDEPKNARLTHHYNSIGNLIKTVVGGVTTTMEYDMLFSDGAIKGIKISGFGAGSTGCGGDLV
jgi:hypothetical protein